MRQKLPSDSNLGYKVEAELHLEKIGVPPPTMFHNFQFIRTNVEQTEPFHKKIYFKRVQLVK